METEWLLDEILTGLQKLYPLSLDRTPAAEILPGTAMAWLEALSHGKTWDRSRDASRIRSAFVSLAQTCDRWPSPKQFMDALPRVEQTALGYEVKPASKAEAAAAMARIRAMLDEVTPLQNAQADWPTGDDFSKAAAEEELRKHYRDGKAAAAGES